MALLIYKFDKRENGLKNWFISVLVTKKHIQ